MKKNYQFLVVVSDFNATITQSLLEACLKTLYNNGISKNEVEILNVPGAFELPVVAGKAARSVKWDAVICLGCVIKGETPHFEYVCSEAARGLMTISIEVEKPIIFGVLTTSTSEQALERAGLRDNSAEDPSGIKQQVHNKGNDAAQAALRTLAALEQIDSLR